MIRLFYFFSSVVFISALWSCSGHGDNSAPAQVVITDSVIEPAKMALILSDVHVVEAALVLERNEDVQQADHSDFYYGKIFEKYHITRNRYDQSLAYYRQNPELFAKMYDEVIRILEERQGRMKR